MEEKQESKAAVESMKPVDKDELYQEHKEEVMEMVYNKVISRLNLKYERTMWVVMIIMLLLVIGLLITFIFK